jgi:DTW domain-containing protein YfiP
MTACPTCLKQTDLCLCAEIEPQRTKLALLILQHPQEQDHDLGTARLVVQHLEQSRLAVGLSWPNLAKALGRPADPKRWGVLYLGSAVPPADRALALLDRAGKPVGNPDMVPAGLDGVVLLDGSWSQAKALWWRNPWLLKLQRLVLNPARPSRYGRLRKEPRRESVSTIEAAASIIATIEQRPDLEVRMLASFDTLLRRYRERKKPTVTPAPAPPAA